MMRSSITLFFIALLALPAPALSQMREGGNLAVLYESYSFDDGLGYSDISELTLPLTVSADLGGRAWLTLSSGFTSIRLTGDPAFGREDQEMSGLVDTEARAVVELIPGRLNFLATATAPTGMEAMEIGEEVILSALSSQVMGLSTTNLGGGGRAGGGFVGAIPVGRMALGLAGTYTHSMAYNPVVGQDTEWKPGGEIRLRAGLEGTVSTGRYLRLTAIFASRQSDQLDGQDRGEVGQQFHIYGALNQSLGTSSLTLYAFDSYRSAPQIEATSVGALWVPKGNLAALGAKMEIPVGRQSRLVPKAEFRTYSEAPRAEGGSGSMESAGTTFRLGADFKQPLRPGLALVVEANGLFGNVGAGEGSTVGVRGFRGGIHLEYRR